MSLVPYRKKRTLSQTPEPRGGKAKGTELRFVVQKHKASRLHYDFRLELRGVLKSWAIPKGPSLNPDDKRLAVQVEDHPYDYKDFEGVIPKGNYGAGTVIVWDEGSYRLAGNDSNKQAMEREIAKQLKGGSVKIVLNGNKLKGEFTLVRMKSRDENAWLLIKNDDPYASSDNVTQQDQSVRSKKTLEEVAQKGASTGQPTYRPAAPRQRKEEVAKQVEKQVEPHEIVLPDTVRDLETILADAQPARRPKAFTPMLASLADEPFDNDAWEFEVKWDGYRAIATMDGDFVSLHSRNHQSFASKFPPVFESIKAWGIRAVVDGEVVAVNDDGIANFHRLQNWRSAKDGMLLYYVFDLPWYDGKDMTKLPLADRKAVLQHILPKKSLIRNGYSVKAEGIAFFDAAKKLGLEGMIAKRADSPYRPGDRSKDWLKIKTQQRQEVVICGYTRNEGTSKLFSALLLGVYENEKLRYVGKVGTGFTDQEQRELMHQFKRIARKTSPFATTPEYDKVSRYRKATNAEAFWVRPTLVCEVRYTAVTAEGVFRHPTYVGLREDKDASMVVAEVTMTPQDTRKKEIVTTGQRDSHAPLDATAKKLVKKINGKELVFTNLDKVFWPDDGFTKGDMLNYYWQVAKYMMPYLKNRPQSLHRFPNGIKGKSFYQKDVTETAPDWVDRYPYRAKGERKLKHYMLCNDTAALLYMANLGTISMNPWSSTVAKPDHPTWCLLDLDPDKGNTLDQVVEVAQTIHQLLEDIGVPSCCKTSGSTGLHVYIPFGANYTFDQSQLFARWIATQIDAMFNFTSIERMTNRRKGKIYIDYLQNRPAATLAAPYSIRPKPGATVSMPLYWEEVKKGLKMADFTIENSLERIKSEGDIFKATVGRGIRLKTLLQQLENM